ncbi:MAG TPA: hypothetical protein VHO70_09690 [Chitinispirillaceae bacterium]|nr:hypothetical protein [Chitinispirillaceae bacterium]
MQTHSSQCPAGTHNFIRCKKSFYNYSCKYQIYAIAVLDTRLAVPVEPGPVTLTLLQTGYCENPRNISFIFSIERDLLSRFIIFNGFNQNGRVTIYCSALDTRVIDQDLFIISAVMCMNYAGRVSRTDNA